jgi:hypothetical protein
MGIHMKQENLGVMLLLYGCIIITIISTVGVNLLPLAGDSIILEPSAIMRLLAPPSKEIR